MQAGQEYHVVCVWGVNSVMDKFMMLQRTKIPDTLKLHKFPLIVNQTAVYSVCWIATREQAQAQEIAGEMEMDKPEGVEVAVTTLKSWGQQAYNGDEKFYQLCPLLDVELSGFTDEYQGRLGYRGNALEICGGPYVTTVAKTILPLITVNSQKVFGISEAGQWPILNIHGLPEDFAQEEFKTYFGFEKMIDARKVDDFWQVAFPTCSAARAAMQHINYATVDKEEVVACMQTVSIYQPEKHVIVLSDMDPEVTALDIAEFTEKYEVEKLHRIIITGDGSAKIEFPTKNAADQALNKILNGIDMEGFEGVSATREK